MPNGITTLQPNGERSFTEPEKVEPFVRGESREIFDLIEFPSNFEEKIFPEEIDKVEDFLILAQREVEDRDYSDSIGKLRELVSSHDFNEEKKTMTIGGQEEEVTAYDAICQVFSDEDEPERLSEEAEAIILDYRQGYKEVLVVLENSLESASEIADEEEQNDVKKRIFEGLAYLVSDEDSLDELEDSFSEKQQQVLTDLKEQLNVFSIDYAENFLEEDGSVVEDFDGRLEEVRKARQERLQSFVREFCEHSPDNHPWEPLSLTIERPDLIPEDEIEEAEEASEESTGGEGGEEAVFEQRTTEGYKRKFKEGFRNWGAKVKEDEGFVINTQGVDSEGNPMRDYTKGFFRNKEVKPPQFFFLRDETVKVPAALSGEFEEKFVKVKVARSTFSEVKTKGEDMGLAIGESSGEEGYYYQTIYSLESGANSIVKAQELLWQLECCEQEDGFYKVPVIREYKEGEDIKKKACWLPLDAQQYNTWRRNLKRTVASFERVGLKYEKVKNAQERDNFEREQESQPEDERESPVVVSTAESHVNQVESDPQKAWFMAHLQLAHFEESFEGLEEMDLDDPEDRYSELEKVQENIRNGYLKFLSIYGRRNEYLRIARRNLIQRGIDLEEDPELLLREVDRVRNEMELRMAKLSAFSSQGLVILEDLRQNPDKIPETPQELKDLINNFERDVNEAVVYDEVGEENGAEAEFGEEGERTNEEGEESHNLILEGK